MKDFNQFVAWEKASQDTIDFKKIYADMAEDTLAGLVLAQIIYWHIPNKQGQSKLRIEKEGKKWMACNRAEWWEKTRLSPRQIDRVLGILESKKIILKKVFRFNGTPIVHIHLNVDVFILLMNHLVENPSINPYHGEMDFTNSLNQNLPNGEMDFDESVESLTKTTAKTTKEDIAAKSPRKKTDADLLGIAYGLDLKATKDFTLFGKLARELKEAGIEADCYPEYIAWVRGQSKSQGNWDVTPHSLTSNARPASFLASKQSTSPELIATVLPAMQRQDKATDGIRHYNPIKRGNE